MPGAPESTKFKSPSLPLSRRLNKILVTEVPLDPAFEAVFEKLKVGPNSSDGREVADSRNTSRQTSPLSLAAKEGHKSVLRLLAEWGSIAANLQDLCGQSPLSEAAARGNEGAV